MEFYKRVAASFPIIWVDTFEYERAINTLTLQVQNELKYEYKYFTWDVAQGLVSMLTGKSVSDKGIEETMQPHYPIEWLKSVSEENQIVFVKDFHKYLDNHTVWRALLNNATEFKQSGKIFVIVSPVLKIPMEIERYVTVVDFDLPTREELEKIIQTYSDDYNIEFGESEKEEILNHGLGLAENEFENALALSICDATVDKARIIYEQKEQLIRKNGMLKIYKSEEDFKTLIGMENLKEFTKGMIKSKRGRGILLVGIQGGGKSEFAKRLGNETSRPVICLDFGDLMGGVVGKTEEKTKMALKTVDAMEPAILFIDEFEKGLAGVSGYSGDSGVSKRQGQKFLTWLSDHETDVFVVATANDISKIPAEYLRAERWDTIFFVDFPTEAQAKAIFEVYKNKYGLDEDLPQYILKDWTGAEIKSLCRMSRALKIPLAEAKEYITNIMNVDSDKIRELQEWAKHKTIPASKNISHINNDDPERQIIISEGE